MAILDGEVMKAFLDGTDQFNEEREYLEEYNKRFNTNFYIKELCLHDLDTRWNSLNYGTKLVYLKDWLEFQSKKHVKVI